MPERTFIDFGCAFNFARDQAEREAACFATDEHGTFSIFHLVPRKVCVVSIKIRARGDVLSSSRWKSLKNSGYRARRWIQSIFRMMCRCLIFSSRQSGAIRKGCRANFSFANSVGKVGG